MGESIFEGTITKWLKKPGDKVQRDEPLFEISTDKVDAEIPAPASGILQEIKVSEGNTVQVNTVVGVIGEGNGASTSAPTKAAAPAPAAPASSKKEVPAPPAPAPAASAPEDEEDSDVRSSPLVRKLAREHNVELAKVSGTGNRRASYQARRSRFRRAPHRRSCRAPRSAPSLGSRARRHSRRTRAHVPDAQDHRAAHD